MDIFAPSFIQSRLIGFMDIASWSGSSMIYTKFGFLLTKLKTIHGLALDLRNPGILAVGSPPCNFRHAPTIRRGYIFPEIRLVKSPRLKSLFKILVLDLRNPAICGNSTPAPNLAHLHAIIQVQTNPFQSPNNENRYFLHSEEHHPLSLIAIHFR